MKKPFLIIGILSTAIAVSSTPMTSLAASKKIQVQKGNGYVTVICPPTVQKPSQPKPEKPESGKPNQPKPEKPESGKPNQPKPEEELKAQAAEVIKLVNEERKKAGLSALKADQKITKAADVRAKEIKQNFSHTRPNGSGFSTALKEQGVSYRMSGENIAWGQKTPKQVMNAWMSSDGHRANILNKNYKNIGVGYYKDSKGTIYWVQLFTA